MFPQPLACSGHHRWATDTQPLSGTAPDAQTLMAPAATTIDTAAHTLPRPAYVSAPAWSAEEPDHIADCIDVAGDLHPADEPVEAPPWYVRPRLLFSAAVGVLAVAAAGLVLTLQTRGTSAQAPAIKSVATAPAVTTVVDTHQAAPVTAPPTPTAPQTVVATQPPTVPAHSHNWTAPASSLAPPPAPPTRPAQRVEHWPPHRSTWPTPPTSGYHLPTRTSHSGEPRGAFSGNRP